MAPTSRATICHLPNEVLVSIFSLLPVADLGRCAATCERWRAIVTGFSSLWWGKTYSTYKSPTECAETRAVLHALPPLQEVVIESANGFMMDISYPHIVLSLKYVSVLQDCPRLRCKFLLTRVDIAGDILSCQSTIAFEGLQHLRILRTWTTSFWAPHEYTADYMVGTALSLCPRLRHLSVSVDSISEENLDAVKGLGQLKCLEISCTGLQKLSFLRHCREALRELTLESCTSLQSGELTELWYMWALQRLRLSDCVFQEDDLLAGVLGHSNLRSLQLDCCSPVRDLAYLQYCRRLTDLHVTSSNRHGPRFVLALEKQEMRFSHLRLPADGDWRLVRVIHATMTAVDLPAAYSKLEELGLDGDCLAFLGNLRNCVQLRHLVCEFVLHREERQIMNVRLHISLTGSAQS